MDKEEIRIKVDEFLKPRKFKRSNTSYPSKQDLAKFIYDLISSSNKLMDVNTEDEELLIPFPPKGYPARDGSDIKHWMAGYETSMRDKIQYSFILSDETIINAAKEFEKKDMIIDTQKGFTEIVVSFYNGATFVRDRSAQEQNECGHAYISTNSNGARICGLCHEVLN